MLDPIIPQVLRDVIANIEKIAETNGWDAPPKLLGLFYHQQLEGLPVRAIEIREMPFGQDVWRTPQPDNPAQALHPTVILNLIADFLADPETRDPMIEWLHPEARTFVGLAFVCEAWKYVPYEGYQHGDMHRVPAMAEAEIRCVAAIDTDGRYYYIDRVRGAGPAAVAVHDEPSPELLDGAVPTVINRIVATIRDF